MSPESADVQTDAQASARGSGADSGDGAVIYKHACAIGYEGIVCKRLGTPYRAGRAEHWLEIENPHAPAVRRLEERIGCCPTTSTGSRTYWRFQSSQPSNCGSSWNAGSPMSRSG
jgi:hypothetical protein